MHIQIDKRKTLSSSIYGFALAFPLSLTVMKIWPFYLDLGIAIFFLILAYLIVGIVNKSFTPILIQLFYMGAQTVLITAIYFGLSFWLLLLMDIFIIFLFAIYDYQKFEKIKEYPINKELTKHLKELLPHEKLNNIYVSTTDSPYGKLAAYDGSAIMRKGVIIIDKRLINEDVDCVLLHEYGHHLFRHKQKLLFSFLFITITYLDVFLLISIITINLKNPIYMGIGLIFLVLLLISAPFTYLYVIKSVVKKFELEADKFVLDTMGENCMEEWRERHKDMLDLNIFGNANFGRRNKI